MTFGGEAFGGSRAPHIHGIDPKTGASYPCPCNRLGPNRASQPVTGGTFVISPTAVSVRSIFAERLEGMIEAATPGPVEMLFGGADGSKVHPWRIWQRLSADPLRSEDGESAYSSVADAPHLARSPRSHADGRLIEFLLNQAPNIADAMREAVRVVCMKKPCQCGLEALCGTMRAMNDVE